MLGVGTNTSSYRHMPCWTCLLLLMDAMTPTTAVVARLPHLGLKSTRASLQYLLALQQYHVLVVSCVAAAETIAVIAVHACRKANAVAAGTQTGLLVSDAGSVHVQIDC